MRLWRLIGLNDAGGVVSLIDAFVCARRNGDRSDFSVGLTAESLCALRKFAGEASALAVRRNSPELIEQGLTVLTILGDVDDARDLTLYLATLYHSAMKLGIDAPALFSKVACLAGDGQLAGFLRDAMAGFPLRPAADRELSAFGLREVMMDDGFNYASARQNGQSRPAGSANWFTLLYRRLIKSHAKNRITKYTR